MYIINTTLTFTPSTFETEPTPPRCTRLTENETIDYDSSPPTALVFLYFHFLQHPPHSSSCGEHLSEYTLGQRTQLLLFYEFLFLCEVLIPLHVILVALEEVSLDETLYPHLDDARFDCESRLELLAHLGGE